MIKFKLENDAQEILVNLPQMMDEISDEYIRAITSEIQVAPNYSLIGMFYKIKVADIAGKLKKDGVASSAYPFMVKTNCEGVDNSKFTITIPFRGNITLPPSQFMTGYKINTPNDLDFNFIRGLFDLNSSVVKTKIYEQIDEKWEVVDKLFLDSRAIYLLDFKIIANSDIISFRDKSCKDKSDQEFVTVVDNKSCD